MKQNRIGCQVKKIGVNEVRATKRNEFGLKPVSLI